MARVAFILLLAFCVFHLSVGAPTEDETSKAIDDGIKNLKTIFDNTFNQENIDKLQNDLKVWGNKLSEQGKAILNEATKQMEQLKNSEPVKT